MPRGAMMHLKFCLVLGATIAYSSFASAQSLPSTNPDELPQLRPGVVAGYIPRDKLIDSLALLPPPPDAGSEAQASDDAARRAAIAIRETARWKLAARDADYTSPKSVDAFACTIGITISPTATPHLNMLLKRTLVDAGLATYKAKIKYNRTRPFVAANDNTTCYPKDEEMLRKDGSYPSGHSAYGWAWALILAEMVPDKADAIIQRGFQFGQNRIICGVHWQSDVNAGRVVAAAVVAQLHTNADFKAQFGAAQKEVQVALANNPTPDCALEHEVTAR
ncbi:MAG: acid phosphatase [Xanthobacteraceae bacterium]